MSASFIHPAAAQVRPTVLYVDDDAPNRQAFMAAFRRDVDVLLASGPSEAMRILGRTDVHVIIADERMPGIQGSALLGEVKEQYPRVRRMLVTGYADLQAVIDAVNQGGVCHYIAKPWDPARVLEAIRNGFADVRRELEQLAYTERLMQSNRQLEFALRQRLLS